MVELLCRLVASLIIWVNLYFGAYRMVLRQTTFEMIFGVLMHPWS